MAKNDDIEPVDWDVIEVKQDNHEQQYQYIRH